MRAPANRVIGCTAAALLLLCSPAPSLANTRSASKVRPHAGKDGAARGNATSTRRTRPRGLFGRVLCRRDCAKRKPPSTARTRPMVSSPRPAPRAAGPRVFKSDAELPRPRTGTVRLYRGTGHPDRVQVSRSMRGRPAREVPRGDEQFFDPIRAGQIGHLHSQGAETHPDAVSMTSDLYTARSVARANNGAVMVYDVPAEVVDRMPRGDRTMGEYIIQYSIPSDFLVGVLPAPRQR